MCAIMLGDDSDVLEYIKKLGKTPHGDTEWKCRLWGATIDNLRVNLSEADIQDLIDSMTKDEINFLKKVANFL